MHAVDRLGHTRTFCSSTTRYFCSKRLHLLTKLLCSVKMEAAVAVLSGELLSLPLLPRVLISSSSLLMLSALHGEPQCGLILAQIQYQQWQARSKIWAKSPLSAGSNITQAMLFYQFHSWKFHRIIHKPAAGNNVNTWLMLIPIDRTFEHLIPTPHEELQAIWLVHGA